MQYRLLGTEDSTSILSLLEVVPYYGCPASADEVVAALSSGSMIGMHDSTEKLVGLLALYNYHDINGVIGFDAAVLPDYEGKWGSKGLFKKLFDIAFTDMGGVIVTSVSSNPKAKHGLRRLGFKLSGTAPDGKQVFTLLKTENRFK